MCDTRTRVVSAKFSRGYLYLLGSQGTTSKEFSVGCDVFIGHDYEMWKEKEFLKLMKEIVGTPIPPKSYLKSEVISFSTM